MDRRGFLKKLGIGTTIMGTAGIFTLNKEVKLATEVDMKNLQDVKNWDKEKLMELCSDILNSIDGIAEIKNSWVRDYVRQELTRNTPYENSNTPEYKD